MRQLKLAILICLLNLAAFTAVLKLAQPPQAPINNFSQPAEIVQASEPVKTSTSGLAQKNIDSKKVISDKQKIGSKAAVAPDPVSQPAPTPAAQANPAPIQTPDNRCIITIQGKRYDVTQFRNIHSGGDIFQCNTDMTAIFFSQHSQSMLDNQMSKYRIN